MSTTSQNESRPPAQFEFTAGKPAASTKVYWAVLISVTLIAARLCFVFAYSASIFFFQPADVSPEVFALIKEHPLLVEHLGEFEDFDFSRHHEEDDLDGDTFAFGVTGSKQWGLITCISRTQSDESQLITFAAFQLTNGESFILVPRKNE